MDGHNRLEILKELGHKEAWCEVWELEDKYADLVLATLNKLHGVDDLEKRAKLLKDLSEAFEGDLSLDTLLPETEQDIDTYLQLADAEVDTVIDSLKTKLVGDRLMQIVEPDTAKRISDIVNKPPDYKRKLVFEFDNEDDFYKAIMYFGRQPHANMLLELICKK